MDQAVRRGAWICGIVVLLAGTWHGQRTPAAETSFADRIKALSEPEGVFDTDNLISNEGSYLEVVPALIDGQVTGGAYVGVGPDQNFSYIARIKPATAYIIDIRRDNLLLHLLFKALFEESPTRLAYLSLLTGRAPPAPDVRSPRLATLQELIDQVDRAERSARPVREQDIEDRIRGFGVPLSSRDLDTIKRFHGAFVGAGLNLRFRSHGRPPREFYPTLRELLLATDREGRQWSYLASDEAYQFVRDLQMRNAIIPVVGDLSGSHAMRAIGAALAGSGEPLSAIYVSNVEDYLFRTVAFARFSDNLNRLPRTPRSMLIRSMFRGGPSVSQLQRVDELMAGLANGKYRTYSELIYGRR